MTTKVPDKSVVQGIPKQPGKNAQPQSERADQSPPSRQPPIITPKRVADRPHWTTILIGILSPSIALVAAWIAIQSLKTSQQSMKVGQRAYLNYQVAVTNGNEVVEKLRDDKDFFLNYQVIVTNMGNTPAYSVYPKIKVAVDPDRTPIIIKFPDLDAFDLGPKESRTVTGQALFKHFHNVRRLPGLSTGFTGQLEYKDVFGDSQVKQVCYSFIVSGGAASGGMCGTVMQVWQ